MKDSSHAMLSVRNASASITMCVCEKVVTLGKGGDVTCYSRPLGETLHYARLAGLLNQCVAEK